MKQAVVLVAFLALCGALFAKDLPTKGALGLTGSVGSSSLDIGGWYNITDAIALRPSIGFSSVSNPDQFAYKESKFTVGISIDALYEFPITDSVALGLGPRLGYSTSSVTDTYTAGPASTSKESYFDIGAVASVQYFFTEYLGIFLDLSLGADFHTFTPNAGSSYTISTLGTGRSGLGAVIFLK